MTNGWDYFMTNKFKMRFCAVAVAVLPFTATYAACIVPAGNFALSLDVAGSPCSTASASSAQALYDKLSTSGLESLGNNYTDTKIAFINANFNSLAMTLNFPNIGTQLNMVIPALGVTQSFTGATRDASKQLLIDYLKNTDIIGRIMNYQATHSPISPIAGAAGILPNVVASDFNQNFSDTATHIASPASLALAARNDNVTPNLAGVSLQYGSLNSLDNMTKIITLPLSYTIRNDMDPRRQFVISLPISEIDTNGAKSYQGSLGAAYRLPINDNWTLTPGAKVSGVGSLDMATLAGLYTLSTTSTYIWRLEDFDISMGNMLSYNKSMKLKKGDYSFDPDITVTALRNGLMLSQPVNWDGGNLSVEYMVVDTRYTGTQLYIDNTQEVGISIGTNKSAFSTHTFMRAGVSYLHGKDTKGINANISVWF